MMALSRYPVDVCAVESVTIIISVKVMVAMDSSITFFVLSAVASIIIFFV